MPNNIQFTIKSTQELLDDFDDAIEERSRAKVIRKLMLMYSKGHIDIDWQREYSIPKAELDGGI